MSKALILKLRKQRDEARSAADLLLTKMESEPLSQAETTNLESLTKEATELDERIAGLTEMETKRIEAANLDVKFDSLTIEQPSTQHQPDERPKTLGELFTASTVFQEYQHQASGKSGLFTTELALIDTVGNTLPGVHRASDSPMPAHPTPLLDTIGYEPVSSNSIDWISWPAADPEAGLTAEGDVKAEADYPPILNTAALDKQAHHIPVTREMLEDVPRTQSIVSGALLRGLRKKAEKDAVMRLVGSGGTLTASHDSLMKSIRLGIGKVSDGGWDPGAVVLNPADYAEIDIELLDYTVNGAVLGKSIWGMKVVPSGSVPAGTAFVLDPVSMTFFDRRVTNVYITDSHAEEFTSNILRILAENRSRTEIVRPEAICKCTVVVGP